LYVFLLELVHYTGKYVFDMDFSWTTSLLFSSLLSLVIGTVVGLTQSRIKRLFAFSTISHVGFILFYLFMLILLSIGGSDAIKFYSSKAVSKRFEDRHVLLNSIAKLSEQTHKSVSDLVPTTDPVHTYSKNLFIDLDTIMHSWMRKLIELMI